MMVTVSIKHFLRAAIFLLYMSPLIQACASQRLELIEKCLKNENFFSKQRLIANAAVSTTDSLKKFIALKHGSYSEPFYMFTLVGLTEEHGVIIFLDDTADKAYIRYFPMEQATKLIAEGEKILNDSQQSDFTYKGYNTKSCVFVTYPSDDPIKVKAFAGRPTNKVVENYISKLDNFRFLVKPSDQIDVEYQPSAAARDSIFVELETQLLQMNKPHN